MPEALKNFAYSTVATAPAPAISGTSLVVAAGEGALFPTIFPFNVTVWAAFQQPSTTNAEIVKVTNIVGDTFTIVRAQEGTSARTILAGDQIAETITKKTLDDLQLQHDLFPDTSGGACGALTVNTTTGVCSTVAGYAAGSIMIYKNGIRQIIGVDYNETTPASGVFTFISIPLFANDIIQADYLK